MNLARRLSPSHTLKHFKVLHERVVILTIVQRDQPRVAEADRLQIDQLSPRFWRFTVSAGFVETPNVPGIMNAAREQGFEFDPMTTSFILSRRSFKLSQVSTRRSWWGVPFALLANNAEDAAAYFAIPKDRLVEVGAQIDL